MSVGLLVIYLNGNVNPKFALSPNVKWRSLGDKIETLGDVCDRQQLVEGKKFVRGCVFGDPVGVSDVVLLGDSHSQAISFYLDEKLKRNGVRGLYLSVDGCESIPYFRGNRNAVVDDCELRFSEMLTYLKTLNSPVVVLNRWTFKFYVLV
jgi:hypothetical protein